MTKSRQMSTVFQASMLLVAVCTSVRATDGWVPDPNNGHCYRLTSSAAYWPEAQAEAEAKDGYLVAINDAQEQSWLESAWSPLQYPGLWIGLYRAGGEWVWSSGEPVTYTNWIPGEPSGDSDYAEMNHAEEFPGQWNDEHFIPGGQFGIIETACGAQPDAYTVSLWHLDGDGTDASGHGNDLAVKTDRVVWIDAHYCQGAEMGEDPWTGDCWNSDGGALTASGERCTYPGTGDWTVEAWVLFPSNDAD